MYNPFNFFSSAGKTDHDIADESAISSAWLSSIVTELTDAIVAYDEHFTILIFNKTAERTFGLDASEVLGKPIALSDSSNPRFKLLVQTIFTSLAPSVVSRSEPGQYPQVLDLNFDDVHLRTTTNRIVDAHGAVQGFVKIIRDRTREVEILRSKSDFLTVAAHQLRTPLTAVNWAFEGLGKETLSPGAQEIVNTGGLAAAKLLKIVDDLLDVAKLEGGKYGYTFSEQDIVAFLDQILADAQVIAREYQVSVYFDHAGITRLPLTFDPQKFGIAISNLLDNAIKYNVPHGTVTVRVQQRAAEPFVVVSVADTGVGVPPDAVQKLFTKFFRAPNVVKFATEGSGLGLYLTKNIIARHGGKIWAESTLNRGSTFYFTIPMDPRLIPQKEFVVEEY